MFYAYRVIETTENDYLYKRYETLVISRTNQSCKAFFEAHGQDPTPPLMDSSGRSRGLSLGIFCTRKEALDWVENEKGRYAFDRVESIEGPGVSSQSYYSVDFIERLYTVDNAPPCWPVTPCPMKNSNDDANAWDRTPRQLPSKK